MRIGGEAVKEQFRRQAQADAQKHVALNAMAWLLWFIAMAAPIFCSEQETKTKMVKAMSLFSFCFVNYWWFQIVLHFDISYWFFPNIALAYNVYDPTSAVVWADCLSMSKPYIGTAMLWAFTKAKQVFTKAKQVFEDACRPRAPQVVVEGPWELQGARRQDTIVLRLPAGAPQRALPRGKSPGGKSPTRGKSPRRGRKS